MKFYCKLCGKQYEVEPHERNRVFCSQECADQFYVGSRLFPCPHNEAVQCSQKQCSACGWHPEVAERRMEKIYG